jgi:glycerol kinase
MTYILAIDQGTSSSRSILFDGKLQVISSAQEEFPQHYPQTGWVEHDPNDLLNSTLRTAHAALEKAGLEAKDVTAIGITNQRETTLLWDRATGKPLHNAIVWQDRRTSAACESLRAAGHEPLIRERTGLLLDPYFSATKLAWLLDTVPDARSRAARGELAFGTVDSFLIWHLTGGVSHVTDATNAARTMLYNIATGEWDKDVCAILDIPMQLLPKVKDCAAEFGIVKSEIFGAEIPILGVAGDQQAATVGQACFSAGMMKSTYGTGCFALLNTGSERVLSKNRLLTTIAYQLNGKPTYALEGSIFVAGSVVQWLRDGLGIIAAAGETQRLAESADEGQDVTLVPAFTGLGAPYWQPDCRGAVFGLSRNSGPAEFARAALESVGYQTRDLLEAMHADWVGSSEGVLRVDGGMVASDWTMQFLSDIIDAPVDRPMVTETTALGAAYLAGLQAGVYPEPEEFAKTWALERRFAPQMAADVREKKYARWKRAVAATMTV